VRDRAAHRSKDGPRPLDVCGLASHEDRQRRLLGALGAAADGSVDQAHAALAEPLREGPRGVGADRGAVDDERARRGTVGNAAVAEQHRLDVGRVRDAYHEDVGGAGEVGRCRVLRGAELGERSRPAGSAVPDAEGEAGAGDVGRHRGAHRAEPRKAHALAPATLIHSP
jgi:hypothetical protein